MGNAGLTFESSRRVDNGLLEMKGSGNRTYYVPSPRFLDLLDRAGSSGLDSAPAVAGQSHMPMPESHMPAPQSHMEGPQSHMPATEGRMAPLALPPELAARLPTPGSRPGRDVLRNLLVALCTWRMLSAREMAAILQRKDYRPLVRDHLSPMVAEGLLAYTIPAMEKHPDQKYTVPPPPAAPVKPNA